MDLETASPSDDAPVVAARRRFTRYDGWTDLSGLIERVRRDARDPALAAAIVRGARIEKAAVGVREAGSDRAVSPSDLFHLGSAAKPMTATLIGRVVEMGKLDWTSTLGALLPDLAMRPEYRAVTVEQLMRHRGGIPRFMNVTKDQVEKYDKAGPTAVLQRAAFVADCLCASGTTRLERT